MKISVCIPTWNRADLLFEALEYPLTDERISEIIVYDDFSDLAIYNEVLVFCKDHTKIKLYRGDHNIDCYRAKKEAVLLASNEYVILLDSDNIIGKDYLDKIYDTPWAPERILQPSFAKPHFDFRKYAGLLVNRKNVAKYAHDSTFTTMLNAQNFFVNRDYYLVVRGMKISGDPIDPVTSDSIYFNWMWLNAGKSIHVVPGLQYFHRVHEGSHYQNNNARTPAGFHNTIVKRLQRMR